MIWKPMPSKEDYINPHSTNKKKNRTEYRSIFYNQQQTLSALQKRQAMCV